MIQPTLEFSNPQEISDDQFSGLLEGLSFGEIKSKKENSSDVSDVSDKTDKTEGVSDFLNLSSRNKNEEDTNDTKDNKDTKDAKDDDIDLPFKNPEGIEETKIDSDVFVHVINTLADKVGFTEVYEGFDPDADVTEEVLLKFIEHNTSKKIDESLVEFFDTLSDSTKRLISYDLNSKGENLETYLKSLVEENNIKSLSIENEYDQEKIVRKWYENDKNFTREEVEDKINSLKEGGLLEKEAKILKPKLDKIAENIAKEQEDAQRQLREFESRMSKDYQERLFELLKRGEVGGIKLNREELTDIYSYLTDDKMDVTLPSGKKAQLSPLEAIVYFNKYDKKGSVENLALATLLLTNPKKFEEVYNKRAETKVVNEFTRNQKYSTSLKIGGEPITQSQGQSKLNKKEQTKAEKYVPWSIKI